MRVDWISREGELPCKKQKIQWGPPVVWCILLRKWYRRVKPSASIEEAAVVVILQVLQRAQAPGWLRWEIRTSRCSLGHFGMRLWRGLGEHRFCILFLFSWLWGSVLDPTAHFHSDLLPHHGGKHQELAFSGLDISELWMIIQTLHACYLEHFVIAMGIWLTAIKYKYKFDPAEKQGYS